MLCAMTNATPTSEAKTVWITFVDTVTGAHISMNTAPALDHMASNITLDDINYYSVCPEFGGEITKLNFKEKALNIFVTTPGVVLKTIEELEGTAPGCWLNPMVIPSDDEEEDEQDEEMATVEGSDEDQEGSVTSMESDFSELFHAMFSRASEEDIGMDDAGPSDGPDEEADEMTFEDPLHIQTNYIHAEDVSAEQDRLLKESIEIYGVISDRVLISY
jgi:hypothetical protein